MSFYSRDPRLATGDQRIAFHGGSYVRYATAAKEKTAHADFSIGSRKFGSLTSFTFSDFDDLRKGASDNPFSDYPELGNKPFYVERIDGVDSVLVNEDENVQRESGYSQYDLLQKFMWKPSDRVAHVLNFQFSNTSDVPRYDRLTEVNGTTGVTRQCRMVLWTRKTFAR